MTYLKTALTGSAALVLAVGMAIAPANAQMKQEGQAGVQAQTDTQKPAPGASGGAQAQGQTGITGGTGNQKPEAGAAQKGQGQAGAEGRTGAAEGDARAQGQTGITGDTGNQKPSAGADARSGQEGEASTKGEARTEGAGRADREDARGQGGGQQATRRGGGDSIKLEQQHVTEIRQYFSRNRASVEPVQKTSISVSVGVPVPERVRLHPLPSAIVVSVPADCPLHYFVWGDDVVIVDSCNREVVEIIVGIA